MPAVLNGRTHPGLLETFMDDLIVELGRAGVDPTGPLPTAFDRDYPQVFTLTKSLRGVRYRHEPAAGTEPPKIITTWAFVEPSGATRWLDAIVPEAQRTVIESSPHLTGAAYVTAVYDAAEPEAVAAFNAAWGVVP